MALASSSQGREATGSRGIRLSRLESSLLSRLQTGVLIRNFSLLHFALSLAL